MWLIDADVYAAEMRKRQEDCRAWKDSLDEGTELYARAEQSLVTFVEAALTLKSQPIIDAIPVEWLSNEAKSLTESEDGFDKYVGEALITAAKYWNMKNEDTI